MKLVITLCFVLLSRVAVGQPAFHAQAGLGYIERFSVGAGLTFLNTHSVTLLYGSTFFYKPKNFGVYLLQYHLRIPKWSFGRLTPLFGVKGGHVVFTDTYYVWEVASVIPFAGLQCPLTGRADLVVQAGTAFSFEQSVKRLNYGEIGHYRDVLPELKVAVVYQVSNRRDE